jgi:DNA end-binding protein Ku
LTGVGRIGKKGALVARAIWTGSLSFGLVNVPVGLFAATQDKTIRFNQFQADTSDRVRQKRVNERTGDEIPFADIVKGYDLGGGEYVIVTPEELEAVEPGSSRTIEISDFVDLDDIDPVYYKAAYYLGPTGEAAQRPYALLRQAMETSNKVGIATMVLRTKQHLVAVRPTQSVLALETMYFADEVRDPAEEIGGLPEAETFKPRELETAGLLIDSMAVDWDPERYHDTYREEVEELIDRKRQGEVIATGERAAEPAPVVDLMAALQASVDEVRRRRGASSDGSTPRPRAPRETAKTGRRSAVASSGGDGADDAGPVADVASLTKAELLEQATALGIEGRSRMKRDELAAAVAAASGAARPAGRRKAS